MKKKKKKKTWPKVCKNVEEESEMCKWGCRNAVGLEIACGEAGDSTEVGEKGLTLR